MVLEGASRTPLPERGLSLYAAPLLAFVKLVMSSVVAAGDLGDADALSIEGGVIIALPPKVSTGRVKLSTCPMALPTLLS